jgi:hypothetical protein
MDIPEPLAKKSFAGGLYAAHCIKMGDFQEWETFYKCVCSNDKYEIDHREPFGMGGSLEEHLNTFTYFQTNKDKAMFEQLDLLIPIRLKLDAE